MMGDLILENIFIGFIILVFICFVTFICSCLGEEIYSITCLAIQKIFKTKYKRVFHCIMFERGKYYLVNLKTEKNISGIHAEIIKILSGCVCLILISLVLYAIGFFIRN